MERALNYILGVVLVVAGIAAYKAWIRPPLEPTREYIEVEVPKPYAVISKVTVTVEKVVTIEKEKVITVEKWPDWFTKDDNYQLTAIGDVPPYEGITRVASVMDVKTGESRLIQNRQPLSFIEFLNEKEIGMTYGTDIELYGRWTFLRVGSFHAAAYASANKDKQMAGLQVSYRW